MVGGISAVNPYVGQYAGYIRARAAMQGARSVGAVSRSAYGQAVQGVAASGGVSAVSGIRAGQGVDGASTVPAVSGMQTGQKIGAASGVQTGQRVGVVSGVLAGQRIGVSAVGRGANPDVPVEAISPIRPTGSEGMNGVAYSIPFLRKGMDPAELAVRMRIQYPGAPNAQKVMEEAECQTCKERKYQDGSDDSGVSYQTPTHIAPEQAAAAVKGHEMEHVVRERAAAEREDRRVVSQSVTMHTAICPECGRVYVSGGTTKTTTASNPQPEQANQEAEQAGKAFSAAA